ncbi:2-hydroxyacid dehydrogenase [Nostocoides veronense]|uniref:2-hydroxyacid dehydrogenase n=1 Tax=Nostocoides veronense TaxID=330836 RepID=A0ABN2L9E4_9MICO
MAKVVVLSRAGRASLPEAVLGALEVRHTVRFAQRHTAPERHEAASLLRDAEVLASTNVTLPVLDDGLLDQLPGLRHIVLYATGYEHLDLAGLAERGITVSTLPEYATNAVAEHALALLFASATRLHLAHDKAAGRAPFEVSLRGVEITSRTLAIIGLGRIGRRLARLASGLGMRVVGVDIDPAALAAAQADGIPTLGQAEALREADLVALTASTIEGHYPILDAGQLALLDKDAFVVNVGRPVLADADALRGALLAGRLRGYAVDEIVLDPHDPIDALLIAEGRVLQSAHSAWWRDEVLARGAQMFGRAIQAAADGAPIHVVPAPPRLARAAG